MRIAVQPVSAETHRALVGCEDGSKPFCVVPDPDLRRQLCVGSVVVLDQRAHAIVALAPTQQLDGETATLERVREGQVEVRLSQDQGYVLNCHHQLGQQIADGLVGPGNFLKVNTRLGIALAPLLNGEAHSHYRFVDTKIPAVRLDDIASPPTVIREVLEHVSTEIHNRALHRKYGLNGSLFRLLVGPSGTGKTLAVEGTIRAVYDLLTDITGIPIERLPRCVVRARPDQYLSKWLGESDKNIARMVGEVMDLATKTLLSTKDGKQFPSPVFLILEELDGVGRARGSDHGDGVYDRILTTLLQHLDPVRVTGNVVVLATSNHAETLVDAALLRRVAGRIERFGRLSRRAFGAVLAKKVSTLPVASRNGSPTEKVWQDMVRILADWYYAPNNSADPGLIELQFAGSTTPVLKRPADFMTPALIARSVEEAAREALRAELLNLGSGIALEMLVRQLEGQLAAIADQVSAQNAHLYCDLPDGVRVVTVRRIPRPKTPALSLINQAPATSFQTELVEDTPLLTELQTP